MHSDIAFVISCKDYTVSGEMFEIWECKNCTLRFTQTVPDADGIGPYYQSQQYVSHSDTKEGLVNKLYHIVRNHTLKTKRELVKSVTDKEKGSLLDVGAGTGAFADTMQNAGWKVTGLEPDETARANAFNNYQLSLNTLDTLHQLPADSYHAITMWHVLEHVHDLHGYLKTYQHILKADGKLIIAVPNYTSKDAENYREYWASYDVPRHLYHFSPKSMEILLENEGFKLKAIKPMWFDSFYVSILSEQYKTGHQHILKAFWNGFISNIKALNNKERCSSVIYIIEKEGR
jgi:SAM-dependent methyltransferase